ncbi:hypothetical protein ACFE04_002065 [Oxalis oulophora]
MQIKALTHYHHNPYYPFIQNVKSSTRPLSFSFPRNTTTIILSKEVCLKNCHFVTACTNNNKDSSFIVEDDDDVNSISISNSIVSENESLWSEIKEIVKFTGPATGLWICGPLMSLIDTAVIGQRSSIQLAALVQHHISVLIFVAFTSGFLMLLFTKIFGPWALTGNTHSYITTSTPFGKPLASNTFRILSYFLQSAFTGFKGSDIIPAANTYVQVIAAYMMVHSLNKNGYKAFAISVPSVEDLRTIFALAAPAFIMLMSKVAFFSLIVYCATSMGTYTGAAHQVMIQTFFMCTVWGEPLCQAAQSFMPEFLYGKNRNLDKAKMLLKSLVIIGATLGLVLAIAGTSIPWLFPTLFTRDNKVIHEMYRVLVPDFLALVLTPSILCFEGTLLAGRDLKFISLSMGGCFSIGALIFLLVAEDMVCVAAGTHSLDFNS